MENVHKYLLKYASKAVILDCFESIPHDLVSIFRKFEVQYKELNLNGKRYWYEDSRLNRMCSEGILFEEITTKLEEMNTEFMFFHVSKLLDFEISDIKNNGFKPTTREMITNKVTNAFNRGYFEQNEYELLLSKITPETQNPRSLFYNYTKITFLLEDSKNSMNINSHWGGESTSWHIDKHSKIDNEVKLYSKLENLGSTCVVINKISYKDLILSEFPNVIKYDLVTLLLHEYLVFKYKLKRNVNYFGAIHFKIAPQIIDVIGLDFLYKHKV